MRHVTTILASLTPLLAVAPAAVSAQDAAPLPGPAADSVKATVGAYHRALA